MSDTNAAPSGAEWFLSITLDGVPFIIQGQVDGFTAKEDTAVISHKPTGTMNVPQALDRMGHSGTISLKPTNPLIHQFRDLIDAAARAGVLGDVGMSATTRYRDGESRTETYRKVLVHSGAQSVKRGEPIGLELTWTTGYPLAAS